MPFTAFDESGILGFFTLRNPNESLDELRFGFVIVNPLSRGKVADIYETSICPLAKVMRRECRKRGISRLKVVYSTEQPIKRDNLPVYIGKAYFIIINQYK